MSLAVRQKSELSFERILRFSLISFWLSAGVGFKRKGLQINSRFSN